MTINPILYPKRLLTPATYLNLKRMSWRSISHKISVVSCRLKIIFSFLINIFYWQRIRFQKIQDEIGVTSEFIYYK